MKVATIFLLIAVGIASASSISKLFAEMPSENDVVLSSSDSNEKSLLGDLVNNLVAEAQETIDQLQNHVDVLSDQVIVKINNLIRQLKAVASRVHGKLLETIEGVIANLQALLPKEDNVALRSVAGNEKNLLGDLINNLVAEAQETIDQLQNHVDVLSDQVIVKINNLIRQLQAVASRVHGKLLETIEGVIASLQALLPKEDNVAFRSVAGNEKNLLGDLINNLVAEAQETIDQLQNHVDVLSDQVIVKINNLIRQLKAVASRVHGKLLETIEGLIASLQALLPKDDNVAFRSVAGNEKNLLENLINNLVAEAQETIDQLQNNVNTMSAQVIVKINNLIRQLKAVASLVHGKLLETIEGVIASLQALLPKEDNVAFRSVAGNEKNLLENLINNLVAEAQETIDQLQNNVNTMSAQVIVKINNLIRQLQAVASRVHGKLLETIEGVIANLQALLPSENKIVLSVENKDLSDVISQLVNSVVAQAQAVVAQLHGHVNALSQQVTEQVTGLIGQLQTAAAVAHGELRETIQGLIANLQSILSLNRPSLVEQTRPVFNKASLSASLAVSGLTRGNKGLAAVGQQIIQSVIAQYVSVVASIQQQAEQVGSSEAVLDALANFAAVLQQVQEAAAVPVATLQELMTTIENLLSAQNKVARLEEIQVENIFNVDGLDVVNSILQQIAEAVASGRVPTSDQISNLISQISPLFGRVPGIGALIDQLTQLMLGQGPLSKGVNPSMDEILAQFHQLGEKPTSDQISNFISQISPLFGRVPGIGAFIDELTQLMIGQGPLSKADNRGIAEVVAQLQQLVATVQTSTANAVQAAQALVQQWIANAISQGQAAAAAAAVQLQAQIDTLQAQLGEAARPLIEALQNILKP